MIEKKFGIIGKPLSHSLSPILHNYWFKKYNISANYSLIEIEPSEIEGVIKKIRNNELHGINVTVPYKQFVIPFLDLIIDDAKETLSVNTISLNEEGKVSAPCDVFEALMNKNEETELWDDIKDTDAYTALERMFSHDIAGASNSELFAVVTTHKNVLLSISVTLPPKGGTFRSCNII